MTVRRQYRARADAAPGGGEHAFDVARQGVADGIRQIDRSCARVDGRFRNRAQELEIAARCIFSRELDVVAIGARVCDRRRDLLEALLPRDAQLVLEMDVGGRQEDVDARAGRVLQGAPGAIDVCRDGARQPGDDWAPHRGGDSANRLKISVRGNWEAGLDDVHAKAIELLREAELFGRSHAEPGGLLAVTKRGVEHLNARSGRHGRTVSGWRPNKSK